uniref:Uncharacterized protein n=1 Tax=Davidia involucrata TaxID=16924 RepID=A0A5B7C8Q7_DAVIN
MTAVVDASEKQKQEQQRTFNHLTLHPVNGLFVMIQAFTSCFFVHASRLIDPGKGRRRIIAEKGPAHMIRSDTYRRVKMKKYQKLRPMSNLARKPFRREHSLVMIL